jgi:hypothetical protein
MFETQCSSYLSTHSIFESKYRSHNHKGTWVSCGCTFAMDIYQRYVFRYHNSSRLKRCWLSDQTSQTSLAKSAGSRLQKRKQHRSNQNSTFQTSPLSSASHEKCLMAKGKKKKEPTKDEREEEDDDNDEYDLDFDKLSKKDMIKIMSLFERLQE